MEVGDTSVVVDVDINDIAVVSVVGVVFCVSKMIENQIIASR